jgi:hypothetical protein
MNSRNGITRIPAVLLALGFLGLMIGVLWADDSTRVDSAEPNASGQITVRSAEQLKDSLFATINEDFKQVRPIFERSCFDCHSQYTHYPWYHKLPLVKWLLDSDIKEGRQNVDFSNGFPFTGKGDIVQILRKTRREIAEGGMPPWDYRMIHWGRTIEGARQDSVFNWIDTTASQITKFFDREHIPYKKDTASVETDKS